MSDTTSRDVPDEDQPRKRKPAQQWRVRVRRDLLKQMLPSRASYATLAKALGVSTRQIKRDVAALRDEARGEIATMTTIDVAVELKRDFDWAAREFMKVYNGMKTATPMERAAMIAGFLRSRIEFIKLMQSLGITLKAADRLQVQHVFLQRLDALDPALLEEIGDLKGEPLVRKLADVLGAEFTAATLGRTDVPLLLENQTCIDSEEDSVDEEEDHRG